MSRLRCVLATLVAAAAVSSFGYATEITVSAAPLSTQESQGALDSLTDGILGHSEDRGFVALQGIKGSDAGQKASSGKWTGDILSPLTTTVSMSIAAANSTNNPTRVSVNPKDADGEPLGTALSLPSAVEMSVAGKYTPQEALMDAVNADGISAASDVLGYGVSQLDNEKMVDVLSKIYDASNGQPSRLMTKLMALDFISGIKSGDQLDAGEDVFTALKSVELTEGAEVSSALFRDADAEGNQSSTLVTGYIFTESDGVAVSMVVPTERAERATEHVVRQIADHFGHQAPVEMK